jgi:hypothetical protein
LYKFSGQLERAMTDTHRMKLREPWQREACGEAIEFRRAFNRPTNLEAHERVFVTIRGATASGSVSVNSRTLGKISAGSDAAFDVTDLLADRNHLVIATPSATDATCLPFAQTAIEIRRDRAD